MSEVSEAEFSGRRVAFAVSILGAVLFAAGLVIDMTRDSIFRHFYLINDASAGALFCVAAAYLHWGRGLAARRVGCFAGRGAQVYAVLICLSQALVWVRVAQRGNVWWALLFLVPTLTAAGLAIVAVHLALREPPVVDP